eukprot:gene5951-6551_t
MSSMRWFIVFAAVLTCCSVCFSFQYSRFTLRSAKQWSLTVSPTPRPLFASPKANNFKDALAKAGTSGILAYGTLNCFYYMAATAIVWTLAGKKNLMAASSVAPNKSKLSLALQRLAKVCVTVWIGSQATKAFRAGGALMLAPVLDKALDLIQRKLNLSSRNRAFALACLLLWSIILVFYSILIFSHVVTH